MTRILIIGGSDAGISAAIRAREVDPGSEVTVIVADRFPNYSVCGLPFWLSGEVADRDQLAHRTVEGLSDCGITLLLAHRATRLAPRTKRVAAVDEAGRQRMFEYDRLIVATGAVPLRPRITGIDLPGVFFLRTMGDGLALADNLTKTQPRSAFIIGSGYVGVEMADALARRGLEVTLLVRSALLKTLDPALGQVVREECVRNHVDVLDARAVVAIERGTLQRLVVRVAEGRSIDADLVLVAAGTRPDSELASTAGVSLGSGDAIRVNESMETNIPAVYAAGDCAQTLHRLLGKYVYLPLGTTAHRQGRVAGENAAGGSARFAGTIGTQVVKVFDTIIARTGLVEQEAANAGFNPRTAEIESVDHKAYYPGATRMTVRITADDTSRRLLGAQMIGHYRAEIAKRVDVLATAISAKWTVDDLVALDLSYTPPVSSPWDPIQVCAQEWLGVRPKR